MSEELPHIEPLAAEGSALLEAGRPLEAVDVLRQAVASGEASAPDLLARAYLDSGSWHAAAQWLGPLVEQGHVRFAGRLGVALAELGDAERAEDALRLAIAHGELPAANDLGILLRDGNRLGEGIGVLARAAEEGDPQAPANLVALHLEDGDVPAAAEAAQRHLDVARPDTVLALAEVRAAQARPDDAEQLFRDAGRLGALRAHTAYGWFLLTVRGDPVAAEREFGEARRHAEPGWAYTMGRFLLDSDRVDEAREFLQVAADSGDRVASDTLAELDADPGY
ncbi:MAG: tetratricopeptide repeat protein [Pseudonocardia sp.]|nr:tetratricopeptide repeat protein [Pseudonocardia sp.]